MVSRIDSYSDLSITQLFSRLDTDQSGDVSENELVEKRPDGMTEEQASALYQKVNWQRSGGLTRGDVASIFQSISTQMQASLIQAQSAQNTVLANSVSSAFNDLDADSSGDISRDEFVSNVGEAMGGDEASALWDQIVSGSGAESGVDTLSRHEFAAGLQSTAVSSSDVSTLESLISVLALVPDLDQVDSADSTLASANPSEMFWNLNSDGNALLNQDEFVAGMSVSMSSERATAIWGQIAGASGVSDTSQGLTESQFTNGFQGINLESLSVNQLVTLDKNTMEQLMALLKTQGAASYLDNTDPSGVFAVMDSNADQRVTEDEFVAAESAVMSSSKASQLWGELVSNSGSEDATDGLSADQFIAGFAAIQTNSSSSTSSSTATLSTSLTAASYSDLSDFLTRLRSSTVVPYNLGNTDSGEVFAQMDANQDGIVTESEFITNRPSTIGETQAKAYWQQIASAAGGDSNEGLNALQFAEGLSATSTALDSATITQLQMAVDTLSSETATLYDMGYSNPSDIFSILDGNQDNIVTYDDFVNARPSSVSEAKAQAVWNRIVLNSDAPDSFMSLNENQFSTGYYAISDSADDEAALTQLSNLLDRINGKGNAAVDMGISNVSDLFATADSDQNGWINKEDFLAIRPSTVTQAQASAYWDQIMAYSDAEDPAAGLREYEFSSGIAAENVVAISSDTIDRLLGLLSDAENAPGQVGTVTVENPIEQFDSDKNDLVTLEEFQSLRPSTMSEDQMSLVWDTITQYSGSEDPSQGLTADQYQQALETLTPDSTASASLTRLNELMKGMGYAVSTPFDKATTSASDLFAALDGNQDGIVTQDDILSNIPEGLNAAQANTLWTMIVGNSGSENSSPDWTNGLSENQFTTGFTLTSADALTDPTSYTTVARLKSFLETVRGNQPEAFDPSAYDSATLFTSMDVDEDGRVTESEFRDNKPSTLDDSYTDVVWQQIVDNSGSSDSTYGLTSDEFGAGYNSVDTVSVEQSRSAIIDRYVGLLDDLLGGSVSSTDLVLSQSTTMDAYLDTEQDGSISRTDYLNGLSSLLDSVSSLDSPDSKAYVLQQFLLATSSYNIAQTGSLTDGLAWNES